MTCVAAIVENENVYMGADSAGISGYDLCIRADEKIFRNGNFLLGFTSSFRMGQLLRYKFKPPKQLPKQGIYEYMVDGFIEEVRRCLTSGGFIKKKDEVYTGGTFIVGYKKQIFIIHDDFQVAQAIDPFTAVGCGHAYAKAVLWRLRQEELTPRQKLLKALQAAEHFSSGVRGPFHIIKLPCTIRCRADYKEGDK